MKTSPFTPVTPRPQSAMPAIVGIFILLACGAAYRTVAAYYGGPGDSVRLPPGTLARLPLDLDGWQGQDIPIDERIIKATDTDQMLTRRYLRRDGHAAVSLMVSYGVRLRDLLPHRPEVCYVTHGWTMRRTDSAALIAGDGKPIPCQIHAFDRAGLGAESLIVLHYYLVDGESCEDVSLLRSKVWKTDTSSHYMAQIQVVVGVDPLAPDAASATAREFACLSAPMIRSLFETARGTP